VGHEQNGHVGRVDRGNVLLNPEPNAVALAAVGLSRLAEGIGRNDPAGIDPALSLACHWTVGAIQQQSSRVVENL
jgi:hypothetical protein